MNSGYKAEVIDRVFFARYMRPPTKEDLAAVEADMAAAHQRLGQQLLYIASIESKVRVPNAEERNNLNNLLLSVRKYCEACFMIIEGSEMQSHLQRVIISGMLIITRTFDNYLSVHKNIESASADMSTRLKKDVTQIIKTARERGVVS